MPLKQERKAQREIACGGISPELLYRIPMQVNCIRRYHSGSCYPICPRCDVSLEREYMGFCDCCGQCLNWAEYEEAAIIQWDRVNSLDRVVNLMRIQKILKDFRKNKTE